MHNDDALERRLGWVLRGGVIASSALLVAGLVLTFAERDSRPGPALIRAGLVVLLATPITRVAASAISYVLSKDWLFVVLTSVVLIELAAAVLAAIPR
ncbi:MAG TPA: DUF1634 domain-containing protein [Vicinamibacterales bacterium]|nr:DUF1634 domain-containing protein [Vicinamibacterales bacterium]